jgi:hypothetical protein
MSAETVMVVLGDPLPSFDAARWKGFEQALDRYFSVPGSWGKPPENSYRDPLNGVLLGRLLGNWRRADRIPRGCPEHIRRKLDAYGAVSYAGRKQTETSAAEWQAFGEALDRYYDDPRSPWAAPPVDYVDPVGGVMLGRLLRRWRYGLLLPDGCPESVRQRLKRYGFPLLGLGPGAQQVFFSTL